MQLDTTQMRAQVEDGIGWIVYDNPERHNAMTREMLAALPGICERFDADPAVRVVVLRGAGERAFVSGADIGELRELRAAPPERAMHDGARAASLLAIDKPVIAMIHGYCLGGGLLTALCADLRIAADDARFGIPAARLGVGYPYEATQALVTLVGPANTTELLFTGRRFDAGEALHMGLVNRVVPKAELEAHVRKLAADISANAPLSIRAAKAAIRHASQAPGAPALEECRRRIAACWESQDFAEGRRAFADKRAPRFAGR
jgi:enoyl-CoA hydratase/carnithine racemase